MAHLFRTLFCLLLLATAARAASHAEGPDGGPAEAAHGFYHFYVRSLDAGQNPLTERAHEARQRLTPRLYAQLRRLPRAEQRAYLLAAPGRDQEWGERLWVKNLSIRDGVATGTVRFRELLRPAHELRVVLVPHGGRWKVDAVQPK